MDFISGCGQKCGQTLFLANKKTSYPLRIQGFLLAGEEGFEPSAYGFGDRRSTS